ncbi:MULTISPECIES: cell division suppressor protein YneA [Halanaerobium]|jgi:nucleoid-associated protein YgaU|uniref:LysM domain-containing protein n=1 Tax=Halanaerobium kushneri TaxID=56779 RepID=A0A1N6PPM0_9FIRM|nr:MULTISPECIES: LysM peptidoglycan-binding domain-containing protein [Halanaerobium]RCW51637.1 LysM domain-containing protein [Halanaerobium sp. ST460_2HS_T2]SIQ06112.1 LysM domain-containing protein [Halanaerobium kushneri]
MNGLNSYTLNYQGAKSTNKKKKTVLKSFLTAAVVIFSLSMLLILIFSLIGFGENSSNFTRHEIKPGESLWSIAAHYYETGKVDLRKMIYEIKKINNIDSAIITPGKELIIPLK